MSASASALQARAEMLKLARMLGREPHTLTYSEQVPVEDLRHLRHQVTEVLLSADGHALSRLATASRLLPAGVSANISQRAFGPLLTARLAALLEPGRAVDVATKLPPSFLADAAIELDPRRASDVIAQIPPDHIAGVTRELAAMDDRGLLEVLLVLQEPERLETVIATLPAERQREVAQRAREAGLIEALGHNRGLTVVSPRAPRRWIRPGRRAGVS